MNEIIKIEGLRKRFGDNEVLKGITTSVKQGEVVAIIGRRAVARVPSAFHQSLGGTYGGKDSDRWHRPHLQGCRYQQDASAGGYGVPAV